MSTSASSLPDKIGRYQILERVGRGGMGVLYRGHDPVLDREVAVKVMLADFSEDADQMRPRFYREAKAAAKLQHRNIVTVFEFAEENNQPHIVMEFLRGVPLSSRMEQSPPLTLDDKLDIARLVDEYVYGYCLQQRAFSFSADGPHAGRVVAYVEGLLETDRYPQLSAIADSVGLPVAWKRIQQQAADPGRFERNLSRLLDGVEQSLPKR